MIFLSNVYPLWDVVFQTGHCLVLLVAYLAAIWYACLPHVERTYAKTDDLQASAKTFTLTNELEQMLISSDFVFKIK